jgi:hypothetical protein
LFAGKGNNIYENNLFVRLGNKTNEYDSNKCWVFTGFALTTDYNLVEFEDDFVLIGLGYFARRPHVFLSEDRSGGQVKLKNSWYERENCQLRF